MRIMPRRSRGIALALVLFVIFIEAVLGFGAISAATLDSQAASQEMIGARAYAAARAGLVRACSQLESNYNWANGSHQIYNLQGATYDVTVVPDPDNGISALKHWKVTSKGTFNSANRTLVGYVVLDSFAKYAYFTDAEKSSSGSTISFAGIDHLSGEVHTNGYFSMITTPQFSAKVTSTNEGDTMLSGGSYHQGSTTTSDPTKFYHYSTNYNTDYPTALNSSPNFSFSGNQASVPMPDDVTGMAVVQNGANITITGNATLTFNANGTVTVVQAGHANQTYSTNPTATIYCDSTVTVSGTVSGRVTVGANKGMLIPSSIVYNNKGTDVLGLVSHGSIQITASQNTHADFEIDASILAFGTNNGVPNFTNGTEACFTVQNYNTGVNRGTLSIFGGLIQQVRGPVGTGTLSGQINTGYAKDYQYDTKLLNTPPPNFPTTGTVKLKGFTDNGALR